MPITLLLVLLSGCKPTAQDAPDSQSTPPAEPAGPAEHATRANICGTGSYLRGAVFGARPLQLDWQGDALQCEGMPRPEGHGARMRFSSYSRTLKQSVAVILAMPELQRGETASELKTNATLIIEGDGQFYSTASLDICWTDILRNEPLSNNRYAITGALYCIAPLALVNGSASITIPQLEFSGLIDWSAS